ncbi:MAG TPA: SEC-C domain-containing protein [Thermodesulfobacteriota bacterium]|nr:SEC-C domain-containing protein [Thermodesulfobacteriota bacterium]
MFSELSDDKFLDLIFTEEDRLGLDYIEEARKRRAVVVPFLSRVLEERKNYQEDLPRFWGVVHAVYILGILGDREGLDALLSASRASALFDNDWIWDSLPECYSRLGKEVIPRLMEEIEDNKKDEGLAVSSEIGGLWNLWEDCPEERRRIEDFSIRLIQDPQTHPEIRADLIGFLLDIGRKDLKPLIEGCFERGEVDLDTLGPEDVHRILDGSPRSPAEHYDLEGFYSPAEIEKRRQRWEEEALEGKEGKFEEKLLRNYSQIPRNAPCPCGSGKKFKKCHLPWVEEQELRIREKEEEEEEHQIRIDAIGSERMMEMEIRQFLARKKQTGLFPEIKKKTLEAVNATERELRLRGVEFYFEPILSRIDFSGDKEKEDFLDLLLEYFNAIATQMEDAPKNKESYH